MAAWILSMLILLVAAGVDGQSVAGLGQTCRSGGNILPIACASGLSCVAAGTAPTNPDVATLGTCQSVPSNATLAVYNAVNTVNSQLVQGLVGGNFLAVANFVTPDVQLVLPNITSPVTLSNLTTLLKFSQLLTPTATSNGSTPVTLLFKLIDANNSLTVQEFQAGALGNVYITALWQLKSDGWSVAFGDITPADTKPIDNTTTPLFQTTPNATTGGNTTVTAPVTANATAVRSAVARASNALVAALSSTPVNATNVNQTAAGFQNATAAFLAPDAQVVLALSASPSMLNFSNPDLTDIAVAVKNATGGVNQTFVAYRQLNSMAALLTSEVVNAVQNVYFTQIWQYLPSNNASTVTNATSTNGTASSWQLTFASINIAPPGPVTNAIALV